ncbi:PTS sugar transporter subunit IIB [Desnuesiella massiliensis]|uniref:PTS sugar transporter subunit IIB n=1 Tax=Desnuesiella massiliensis TaxID=1650662 RepID=UPI0006E1C102|nr:PTS sugar transporter subunit IIB [Desnuesiella massiliensis]
MKILLVCAAGMSTSLIVEKMKKSLKPEEADSAIVAVPVEEFESLVKDYDVVLLGPQIRYKKVEFEAIAKKHNIPLDVINTMDYGLVKGDKILDHARKLYNSR